MPALFLSHSTENKAAAESLRDDLLALGYAGVFIDNHSILPGQAWEPVLYERLRSCRAVVALVSAEFVASRWCFAEITHARALGRPIVPVVLDGTALPEILRSVQARSLQGPREQVLDRLRRGLEAAGVRASDALAWDPSRPPYPGLSSFDAEDAGVYFGRDGDVRRALDRVHDLSVFGSAPRALVLMGASGTGKSSLLRAGVLPRLSLDPSRWVVLDPIRPAQQPITRLAAALAARLQGSAVPYTADDIAGRLRSPDGGQGVLQALAGLGAPERSVVVPVDQLEELVTAPGDECLALRAWLDRAARLDAPRVILLGALRSDRVSALEAVAPWASRSRYLALAPLSEPDLLRTITAPAEAAGLTLEAGLAQAMLADVRARQALPLLAFALRQLWERRSPGGALSMATYTDELERIDGAVRRAAEAAAARHVEDPEERAALRRALLMLVQVSPDGRLARQRAPRSQLPERAREAVDALIGARLLVADGDLVEPAHEALFGAWKRLSDWVEEARDALVLREEADIDADRWIRNGRGVEYLWPQARTEKATRALATADVPFSAAAEELVAASNREIERRRTEEKAAQEREVARLQRQRLVIGGVAAVALAAAAVAIVFYINAKRAQGQASASLRASLLQAARASCRDVGPGARDTGLQALRDAAKIQPGADLRDAYVECLQRPGLRETESRPDEPAPRMIDILTHRAAGVTATVRPSGAADTFDVVAERAGMPPVRWSLQAREVDSIRVSPDGELVALVHYPFSASTQTLALFDARDGRRRWSLLVESSSLGAFSYSSGRISFDAAGRYVAVAGHAGSVAAWDLSTMEGPAQALRARPFAVGAASVAVSPDGRWVAAAAEDGAVVVLAMETGDLVARSPSTSPAPRAPAPAPPLEWAGDGQIRLGGRAWQWLAPIDQGFWARANVGRERAIEDIASDRRGVRLGVGSRYGGPPTVVGLSGPRVEVEIPAAGQGTFLSSDHVFFDDTGESVCGVYLSAVSCRGVGGGEERPVAGQDFRLSPGDVAFAGGQVLAAGQRESTLLEARRPDGRRAWEKRVDRASIGPIELLFDPAGGRFTYRSLAGETTVFDVVQLRDGAVTASTTAGDQDEDLDPLFVDGQPVLLRRGDLTVHAWADLSLWKGPFGPPADRFNSRFLASGHLLAERSSWGGIFFVDLQSGRTCQVDGLSPPRNAAAALSASGKLFAAFDGGNLGVWATADCRLVRSLGPVDAVSLAFTPDDAAIRYVSAASELATIALASGARTSVALAPLEGCLVTGGGRGWSRSADHYWYACGRGHGEVVARVWDGADGHVKTDIRFPAVGLGPVAVGLDPDLTIAVAAATVAKASIWLPARLASGAADAERCTPASEDFDWSVRLIDEGRKAAWVDRAEPDEDGAPGRDPQDGGAPGPDPQDGGAPGPDAAHSDLPAPDAPDGGPPGADPQDSNPPAATLRVIDTTTCAERALGKVDARAHIAGATPDGAVVIASPRGVQAITDSGNVQWTSFGGAGDAVRGAVSADGTRVAAALRDGTVLTGKPGDAGPRARLRAGPGAVTALAFAGAWLAAGTADGRVHLWNLDALESELAQAGLGPAPATP